uniref:Putative secreted protein n=1 Tax=Ixodes ricinus TaxID=34613 RepID=A0A6B0UE54_IXORI
MPRQVVFVRWLRLTLGFCDSMFAPACRARWAQFMVRFFLSRADMIKRRHDGSPHFINLGVFSQSHAIIARQLFDEVLCQTTLSSEGLAFLAFGD